jgi:ABC-type lipoprotein release transport system permease subunit
MFDARVPGQHVHGTGVCTLVGQQVVRFDELVGGVWLVARSDLRRRWPSLLGLVVIVGVAGAGVLIGLAGARRTESALPRLMEQTRSDDVSVEVGPEHFGPIEALPEVAAAAPASFMFVSPDAGSFDSLIALASVDGRFGDEVNRPLLVSGRRPDPERADEALVNTAFADRFGVEAGDPLTLVTLTPAQVERLLDGADPGPPAGPLVELVAVGIGTTPEELANDSGIVILTPAFLSAHRDDVAHFDEILMVRLKEGARDLAAFRAGVDRIVPASAGVTFETTAETTAEIEHASRVQAVSLVLVAAVIALAGLVAIGQALSRQCAASIAEHADLRALGFSPRQRLASLVMPALVAGPTGAALALVVAYLASSALPTGFAGRVEPDPGLRADDLVLGLGFVAIVAAVSVLGLLAAWTESRRLGGGPPAPTPATRRLLRGMSRAGAPPPALVGVRMALPSGQGRAAVPVRAAVIGAVLGTTGVIAALTFRSGLDWVVGEPAAYGWTWDAAVQGPAETDEVDGATEALGQRPDVRRASALRAVPLRLGGVALQSYGFDGYDDEFAAVLSGRAPRTADEVLLGTETLDRLGVEIGDAIDVAGLQGATPRSLTIVGRGVFPEFVHPAVPESDSGAYDDFALLTTAGLEPYVDDAGREFFSVVLVRWADGVDAAVATARLAGDADGNGVVVEPPVLPSDLANLNDVEAFPTLVAAFFAVLAILATVHTLVVSVHRRARDLALLRTLGFLRGQVRRTVAWQATTFATVGLIVGIPAGIVVGRLVWATVASRLGVAPHTPIPVLPAVLAIPVGWALAIAIATLAARGAAGTPIHRVLRAE